MVLDYAMQYHPDLVLWLVTLEAFPVEKQLTSPIVANNADRIASLLSRNGLEFPGQDAVLHPRGFLERSIIGQRRPLADLVRLQLFGVMWAATGIDQTYPADFQPAQTDFSMDESFHDRLPPILDEKDLAFNVLEAGIKNSANVPVIIVNEPILVSNGKNSELRYNFFYPRWAFDQWRIMMSAHAEQEHWEYLDLWNIIPAGEFTNSAIHLTPAGELTLAGSMAETIQSKVCR
jgi:hypothetical protein